MKVLVYHRRGEEYRRLIWERFPELDVAAGYSAEVLGEHLADADIVIARWFPVERLREARRLRWLQATSAGVEHLVPAAEALRGIVVTKPVGAPPERPRAEVGHAGEPRVQFRGSAEYVRACRNALTLVHPACREAGRPQRCLLRLRPLAAAHAS